ncbi:MAG: hypothetical protein HUJ22_05545 [Gracilimonas sp.]|uniref:hypothetical protein n=1 Tax=Gracilimonas sp. TaxID=1974203 RepID=UPI0019AE6BA8|nr:hypothetical protein [Gracilimonas sp.]MBD3616018.1 hypothetical protein [Gracilimonas sp.]
MNKSRDSVLKGTIKFSALLMLMSVGFFLLGEQVGVAVLAGVMLSSIFVSSSAWIFDAFKNAENSLFIKVFFFSTGIRFLLVLALFGILLGVTKIDEFYFTVSFIISYLCQSVTEMIFINKILQKE